MRIRKLDSHIKKYHPVSNYANQKFLSIQRHATSYSR